MKNDATCTCKCTLTWLKDIIRATFEPHVSTMCAFWHHPGYTTTDTTEKPTTIENYLKKVLDIAFVMVVS